MYINGSLVFNSTGLAGVWRVPILRRGCVAFGHDMDTTCGLFDERQALNGMVDEVRVWSVAKSPSEIQRYWNRTVPIGTPNLNLYWRFDDPTMPADVSDLSGNGNNGALGKLPGPKNIMTWSSARAQGPPTKPKYVQSPAPFIGGGEINVLASPGETISIRLLADTDIAADLSSLVTRISAVPTSGSLAQGGGGAAINTNGTVVLGGPITTVDFTTPASSWAGTSFIYDVDDGVTTATATVNVIVQPIFADNPPALKTIVMVEDDLAVVTLGGVSQFGTALAARIAAAPSKGSLYQIGFLSGSPHYQGIDRNLSRLLPITTFPAVVAGSNGAVIYVPGANEASTSPTSIYSNLTYNWVDSSVPSSPISASVGAVQTIVYSTDDAPRAFAQLINITDFAAGSTVSLSSSDVDQNYATRAYYAVSSFPAFGDLFQVNADGSKAEQISDRLRQPSIEGWASRLMNYSSQYSRCGGCNYPGICPTSCTTIDFNAVRALGPPDVPGYGDSPFGWDIYLPGSSFDFIELGYEDPVYPSGLRIIENFTPGTITRILVAAAWNGTSTRWSEVWNAGSLPGGAVQVTESIRLFSPRVCPVNFKAQYVRLELNPSYRSLTQFVGIDAVALLGVADTPGGIITHSLGKLQYVPRKGIFFTSDSVSDSFSYTASDCEFTSAPATVGVRLSPPSTPSATSPVSFAIVNQTILADGDVALSFPTELPAADFIKSMHLNASSTPSPDISLRSTSGANAQIYRRNPDGSRGALVSLPADVGSGLIVNIPLPGGPLSMIWWASFSGVTYAMTSNVAMDCPLGMWPSNTTGQCVQCSSITKAERSTFSPSLQLKFENVCIRVFIASPGIRITFLAIACLGIAVLLAFAVCLIMFRRHPAFKASSIVFSSVVLVGSALGLVEVLLMYPYDNITTGLCVAKPWVGNLSFVITFAALYAKTWRLVRIFSNKKLRVLEISNFQLFKFVGVAFGIVAIYLIVWSAVDTPTPSTVTSASGQLIYRTCYSKYLFWQPVALGVLGLAFFTGIYLIIKVRKVPSTFNESRWISFSMYNTLVMGSICIILVYVLGNENPDIEYLFSSIGFIVGSLGTAMLIFVPKFYIYAQNPDMSWRDASISKPRNTTTPLGTNPGPVWSSHPMDEMSSSTMMEEIARLRSENEQLKQKLPASELKSFESKSAPTKQAKSGPAKRDSEAVTVITPPAPRKQKKKRRSGAVRSQPRDSEDENAEATPAASLPKTKVPKSGKPQKSKKGQKKKKKDFEIPSGSVVDNRRSTFEAIPEDDEENSAEFDRTAKKSKGAHNASTSNDTDYDTGSD